MLLNNYNILHKSIHIKIKVHTRTVTAMQTNWNGKWQPENLRLLTYTVRFLHLMGITLIYCCFI